MRVPCSAPVGLAPALLLAALALGLGAGCGERAGRGGSAGPALAAPSTSPVDFGELAPFRLTERSGRSVSRDDLRGQPWLAAFLFTRCSTICPGLTRELGRVQAALEDVDARIVSFTVDPEHDTPELLREYADEVAGADPERWLFLTGDQGEIYRLIESSFLLAVKMEPEQDPGLLVTHSSRLVAIDDTGRIRGWYDGESDAGVAEAVARVRFLAGAGPMASASPLPRINASLNAAAAVLLALGYAAIRRGRRELHARLMSAAFAVSAVFLACYLYYHFVVIPAQGGPVRYRGVGGLRALYYAVLVTHVVGALVNLPMVLRTMWLAVRRRYAEHKRWARRTFPLWMYVSVTGVVVYAMLYPWNPH